MNLDKYKNDEIILVTPNSSKEKIIRENSNKFLAIKYMSLEEFKNNYFFSYTNRTIDYLITKYNYKLDFCKTILNNLYVIDLDKEYNSKKLINLQNIKKDLMNNELLEFNPLFKNYLENKKIIVYNYPILDKYELEMFKNSEIINYELKSVTNKVYHFDTLEHEVIFCFEEIIKLLKQGISPNKIYIENISNEYLYTIKKIASYYNIPVNIDMDSSIYGTFIVKDYLENNRLPGFTNKIVKSLVNVVNSLVDIKDSPNYNEFLIDKLKHTKIGGIKYKNGINIVSNIFVPNDDEYMFLVGFNGDSLPKTYKDEDYLEDLIRPSVNMYTTTELNKLEKNRVISIISNTKNIFLSYKEKSNFSNYLKSNLIDDLSLEEIDYSEKEFISSSNFFNKILLTEELDKYTKYGEKSLILPTLLNNYKTSYNSYDNKFSGILESDLYKYIDSKLKVSYTSLNSYYKCKFQYFINYILRINPFKESLSATIGSVFHYMFSVMDNPLFSFDREWNNYLNKQDLSIKERFFIENLKEDLISIIEIIKEQDASTKLKDKLYEQEINIDLGKNINVIMNGKVDKIMSCNVEGKDLISIIDYKTGSDSPEINNIKYGLNMQLPIYLYLVDKAKVFESPKVVGIYLQKVLDTKYKYDKKSVEQQLLDSLKLQGYSTDCKERLAYLDPDYENSNYIKSMKLTKEGNFYSKAKVLSDSDFSNLLNYTDKLINEAVDNILKGDFSINPKIIDDDNVSCEFCKFKDICFKTNKDLVYLDKVNDLDFLGGEEDGLDN